MSSRDRILAAVRAAQPSPLALPPDYQSLREGALENFKMILEAIGGKVYLCKDTQEVGEEVMRLFPDAKRIVSSIPSLKQFYLKDAAILQHHSLHDVEVAIIEAALGVAENGAVWITERQSRIRVLPFITEALVVMVKANTIVPTMHHAYERIGSDDYGFGVFIAGPSKTADIEQSLVLGAHGPKSMTVFVL